MDLKKKIKKDALFLIDGSYFLYRSYFALPPLYTAKGHPTQATHAFCRTLNKLIKEFDPEHIAVVWDSKGGSKARKEAYSQYKANRPAPPDDIFIQKEDIMEFIKLIGMCNVAQVGYEADDLIGSIAKNNRDHQTVLVGADKDMYQLLSKENVIVFDPFKDRVVDAQLFEKEKGFSPEKVTFYYALVGDTSDNIPGVKGVGDKSASELVNQFDSLKDLYENLDKVTKSRVHNALEQHKEDAFLSLQLFTIDYKDFKLSRHDSKFDKQNWVNAVEFFERLELKSLLKDLGKKFPEVEEKIEEELEGVSHGEQKEEQQSFIPKVKKNWKCHIIWTFEQLEALIKNIKKAKLCALDTETNGFLPLQDDLVGISFAYDKKNAFYIPFGHPESNEYPQLDQEEALEKLRPVLESEKVKKTLHHIKFDELVLWNNDIELKGVVFDSLLAANLLRKEWEKINLKDLSYRLLDEPMRKFKDVVGSKTGDFSTVPIQDAAQYGAHDSLQTFKLKFVLEKELKKEPVLKKLYDKIDMPLNIVLTKIEKRGVLLDPDVLKHVKTNVSRKIKTLEEKIFAAIPKKYHEIDGEPLNLSSPKQIEVLLFDYLGLTQIKKSKKGSRSTDREVLEELGKISPIPALIMNHRELTKLLTTYLDPLPGFINEKTGRVHTSFSQTMVVTGRLSSSNPNLQNIPASAEYGLQIREAFIAPRGFHLLSADYSQIELRVLAHISGDKNLIKAFSNEHDIHTQTAAQLFNVDVKKVTHQQRQIGKRINFSIMYGKTPYGLSRELGITSGEAKDYIDKYFEQYPEVLAWMEETIEHAQKKGYVQGLWGRRRWIPQLREKNKSKIELGKRLAVNSPIQSTQADLIKIAMINIEKAFEKKKLGAGIILQIHDELVFEVPNQELEMVEKIVKKEMERVVSWEVPILVNMKKGKNWGEITK
ncbi:MAG: DNA polymerase I [bacterium]